MLDISLFKKCIDGNSEEVDMSTDGAYARMHSEEGEAITPCRPEFPAVSKHRGAGPPQFPGEQRKKLLS